MFFSAPYFEAAATMCVSVRDQDLREDTKEEHKFYETLYNTGLGDSSWNKMILQCNRHRDKHGGEIRRIMKKHGLDYIKNIMNDQNLNREVIRGRLRYFGTFPYKYRYVLSRNSGEWKLVLPYNPIVNDVVKNRIDFRMGTYTTALGSTPFLKNDDDGDTFPAWRLYDKNQVTATTKNGVTTYTLKTNASPIAETKCSSTTYFKGKSKKYSNQTDEKSNKRDRSNRHIDLGMIQHRTNKQKCTDASGVISKCWLQGCRVRKKEALYWNDPSSGNVEKVKPSKWILNNFIRTGEEYWSINKIFKLKILLKGFNEDEFSSNTLDLLKSTDYLKIRFGSKFMPNGHNQMYKANIAQFNNFSTMTTNGTYWHEIGHAMGLDDEYGKDGKKRDCDHTNYIGYSTSDYQMCNSGSTEDTTIYHYIATSRYLLTQKQCFKNKDCGEDEYCNNRLGKNRCLPKRTAKIGQYCVKDKECASRNCQGVGKNRMCVCRLDKHCESDQFCKTKFGKNQCLKKNSKGIGEPCSRNKQCHSNKCQGRGEKRVCVCSSDSDCGFSSNLYCAVRLGKNQCLEQNISKIGQSCSKNKECYSGKCQGTGKKRACVCSTDRDCSLSGDKYCDKRLGKNKCRAYHTKSEGQSCSKNKECKSKKCKGLGRRRKCAAA